LEIQGRTGELYELDVWSEEVTVYWLSCSQTCAVELPVRGFLRTTGLDVHEELGVEPRPSDWRATVLSS